MAVFESPDHDLYSVDMGQDFTALYRLDLLTGARIDEEPIVLGSEEFDALTIIEEWRQLTA